MDTLDAGAAQDGRSVSSEVIRLAHRIVRILGMMPGLPRPAACALLLAAAVSAGCSSPSSGTNFVNLIRFALSGPNPPAAESNLRLTEEEEIERRTLDASEQAEALAALRSVAAGLERTERPQPAAQPAGRWADIPLAVQLTSSELEMALVRTRRDRANDEIVFDMVTIDERPVRLIVRRVDDARVYAAEASVGRFDNDPASARRLIDLLRFNVAELGKKRGFE